nr:terpene synthase 39 [Aquilaria agallochum]
MASSIKAFFAFPSFTAISRSNQPQLPPIFVPTTKSSQLGLVPKSTESFYSRTIMEKLGSVHTSRVEYFRQVMRKMGDDREQAFEGLAMIDAVQRLALDHYFHDEIQELLHKHHQMLSVNAGVSSPQLHEAALSFRLLRQHGYNVPAGMLGTFKDMKVNNKQRMDIEGLMELYEASQLGVDGEDILDDAEEFSGQHLREMEPRLHHHQASAVRNTLRHPYHKNISSLVARNFRHGYQGPNMWIYELQELAKLDFNLVQSLHQTELHQVSRWWKEVGLSRELELVRDQPLKWYTWSLASIEDPSLSNERVELTKPIAMVYVIDDIFDVYGTLDELILFTQVLDRWDYSVAQQLPEYMKTCFKALDDITNELSDKVKMRHGWNPLCSLRKTWGSLCKAFLMEAKWFNSGTLPGAEEYLENGIVSSGVHVALVHLFFLLGQNLNRNTVDQIDSYPGVVSSSATILRLWDDLGSAKDENQEGNDGSYVECYLKEQDKGGGVGEVERARKHVKHKISNAWKRLNRECLLPNPFSSSSLAKASLNVARMVPLMYDYDEEHRLPSLHEFINSVLYEPAIL